MENQETVIELGAASAVTEGTGGPLEDQAIGRFVAGLSED